MSYPLGSIAPLSITVRDASGVLADATVAVTVTRPDLTTALPAVQTSGTGSYYVDYLTTQAGRHSVHWDISGAFTATYDDVFDVWAPEPAPIVGLADMKTHLNLTRTTDDAELYEMGRAISDAIESHLGFPVRPRTVVEKRDGGQGPIFLRQVPCSCTACMPYRQISVTSVVEFGNTLVAGTDYLVDADAGSVMRGPYGWGVPWIGMKALDVVITYQTGYSITPAWARLAFLRAVANSWQGSQQRPHPGFRQRAEDADPNFQVTPYALPYPVQSLLEPHRLGGF